jgi:hypothetical protein
MSSESPYSNAEAHRATAERMRQLAVQLRFSEARRELLDLADRFDRLAVRAEAMASSANAAMALEETRTDAAKAA